MFPQGLRLHVVIPTLAALLGCCSLLTAQIRSESAPSDPPFKGNPHSDRSDELVRALIPVGAPRLMSTMRVEGINSPDRDNSPIVSADGGVMFFNSTRRGDRPWARYNSFKKRYDEDIYFAVRSVVRRDEEAWEAPVNIGMPINSSEDDGVVSISPDGQRLYFNSLKTGWENDGGPFYHAHLRGAEWSEITGLGGGITDFFRGYPRGDRFRIYGGSISSDGNDFYFATTLFAPTNKHQIWVSHKGAGGWSYPENLGSAINDGFGSYAPCIAADGRTLFFASSAPRGFGGDDIYVSKLEDGAWTQPINIGDPINSKDDNSFLSLPASGDRVYFSVTNNGNEDIYVAPLPEMMRPQTVVLVSGTVVDRTTGKPLEATVTIEDLATRRTVFKANSNALHGGYTTVLQAGRDYGISISAPGYVFLSERYTIAADAAYSQYRQDFPLEQLKQGESFALNNIFFNYNDATLSPESGPELDRVSTLMGEHPGMTIEIHGHTDNVGPTEYNRKLSLRRAMAVRDYLVANGVLDTNRISVRGFGSTRPIASNKTEEGRHQNRRSEFMVLKIE